jgi:hypothetical protein
MEELNNFLRRAKTTGNLQYLIENILVPKRYLLFAGRTGIGKTILTLQLMFSFATGQPWLGFKVQPCTCLYINLELPDFQLAQRIEKQLTNVGNLLHQPKIESRPFERMPLEKSWGLKELEVLINDSSPQIIIIDSLRQCYGGKIKDNDQAAIWAENLYQIMNQYDVGVIVVQNTAKARPFLEAGAIEESIGAIEFPNRAVSVMVVTPKQQRTASGRFGSKSSDEVEVYIPKYGCSTKELGGVSLKLNRQTLLYDVI